MEDVKIPKWKKLYNEVLNWPYESIHSHEDLESLIESIKGSNDYYNVINRANKSLILKGKMLISIRNVGYQVLKPDEYSSHSTKIFKQGNRKIRKAKDILAYAPTKHMSRRAKKEHQKVFDRISSFSALVEGGCKEVTLLQNSAKTMQLSEDRPSMNQNNTNKNDEIREII